MAGAYAARPLAADTEQRVREGRAYAALVMLDDDCSGWCQFGSPGEVPEVATSTRHRTGDRLPAGR